MRLVVFLDLDDTIFQTRPKCPDGEAVRPAAYRRDGTPLSFMTGRQHALLEHLFRAASVIPTTARNLESFRRVELPFEAPAILDFGGVVLLPDGRPDPAWDERVRPQAFGVARELEAARERVARLAADRKLGVTARVIADFDMPLYLVVKHAGGDCSKLEPVRAHLAETVDRGRYFLHCNDNNLSLVPRFLGKEKAVRHVMEHHLGPGPVLTVGVGDSLTDAPFLGLCDYALLPRDCQLARHRLAGAEEL